MWRERSKSVQDAARKAGVLVIHVAIDYQPRFLFPKEQVHPRRSESQRCPPPAWMFAELLKIVDEVKPAEGEPVVRKPRMNPFFGTAARKACCTAATSTRWC